MMPSRVLVSGPKRCWSKESSNLIFGAPVLPVRNKTMAGFVAPWLRGNRQCITFMVEPYYIYGCPVYYIYGQILLHLWLVGLLHLWLKVNYIYGQYYIYGQFLLHLWVIQVWSILFSSAPPNVLSVFLRKLN